MNVGFIGAGLIAPAHFEALSQLGVKVSAVHTRGESGKIFASKHKETTYAQTLQQLVEAPLSAVFVLTHPLAYPDLLPVLKENNIPTFLEKPLAYTARQAESLIPLAPPISFVGLNRRFYSIVQKVKAKITDCPPFAIELIMPEREKDYINRPKEDRDKWPMLNSIHGIDLAVYLAGLPEKVLYHQQWGSLASTSHPQYTSASYRTKTGNLLTYTSNMDSSGGWRIHIHLPKEQITLSPLEKAFIRSLSGEIEILADNIDHQAKPGFTAQARTFIEGIQDPTKRKGNWISIEDAIASMKTVEMLHPEHK